MSFTNLKTGDDTDDHKSPYRVYADERYLLSGLAQN